MAGRGHDAPSNSDNTPDFCALLSSAASVQSLAPTDQPLAPEEVPLPPDDLESVGDDVPPPLPIVPLCEAPVETKFRPGAVISSASQHEFDETIHFFRVEKERAARNEPLPRRQTGIILSAGIGLQGVTYLENVHYTVMPQPVGRGTFGQVHECWDNTHRTLFARKQVSLARFESREVEVLRQIQVSDEHHAPTLYGIILHGDVIYIFMEFIDNNWHKLALVIHERQLLTSREGCELVEHYVLALLRQLLKSLNLLEIQKICHCDIKPENLGCCSKFERSYLMDFGTVRLHMDAFSTKGMTPNYMAPEACRGQHTHKSDVWAAAASVIYVYSFQHPYGPATFHPRDWPKYKDPGDLIAYIAQNGHRMIDTFLHGISDVISERLHQLLVHMLHPDEFHRFTAAECLHFLHAAESRFSSTTSPYNSIDVPISVANYTIASSSASNAHCVMSSHDLMALEAVAPQRPVVVSMVSGDSSRSRSIVTVYERRDDAELARVVDQCMLDQREEPEAACVIMSRDDDAPAVSNHAEGQGHLVCEDAGSVVNGVNMGERVQEASCRAADRLAVTMRPRDIQLQPPVANNTHTPESPDGANEALTAAEHPARITRERKISTSKEYAKGGARCRPYAPHRQTSRTSSQRSSSSETVHTAGQMSPMQHQTVNQLLQTHQYMHSTKQLQPRPPPTHSNIADRHNNSQPPPPRTHQTGIRHDMQMQAQNHAELNRTNMPLDLSQKRLDLKTNSGAVASGRCDVTGAVASGRCDVSAASAACSSIHADGISQPQASAPLQHHAARHGYRGGRDDVIVEQPDGGDGVAQVPPHVLREESVASSSSDASTQAAAARSTSRRSSGYVSNPPNVTVTVTYTRVISDRPQPTARSFPTHPGYLLHDVWPQILRMTRTLIGPQAELRNVYYMEGGAHVMKDQLEQPIARDRWFDVHL